MATSDPQEPLRKARAQSLRELHAQLIAKKTTRRQAGQAAAREQAIDTPAKLLQNLEAMLVWAKTFMHKAKMDCALRDGWIKAAKEYVKGGQELCWSWRQANPKLQLPPLPEEKDDPLTSLRDLIVWVGRPGKDRQRRHRQTSSKTEPKLTPKQLEAVQVFGDCQYNYSETKRKLGLSYSAARNRLEGAYKKLGEQVPKLKKRTHALPTGRRGEVNVTAEENHRFV